MIALNSAFRFIYLSRSLSFSLYSCVAFSLVLSSRGSKHATQSLPCHHRTDPDADPAGVGTRNDEARKRTKGKSREEKEEDRTEKEKAPLPEGKEVIEEKKGQESDSERNAYMQYAHSRKSLTLQSSLCNSYGIVEPVFQKIVSELGYGDNFKIYSTFDNVRFAVFLTAQKESHQGAALLFLFAPSWPNHVQFLLISASLITCFKLLVLWHPSWH